jgi:hypothetical protein
MTIPNQPLDVRRRHRPMLGADWRRQLAASRSRSKSRPTKLSRSTSSALRRDDPALRECCAYLEQAARHGVAAARAKFPLVAQAEDLEHDPARREAAMILVLGGITADEMSDRLAIPRPAIELWESLNFDLRDLLQAMAWMWAHVIRPEQKAGRTQLAARLKLALMAGPEAARALVSCELSGPVDEAERLFQRDLKLAAKIEEAADLPLRSERETMTVLRLPIEIKRLDLAKAKLAEKCTKARDRHELKVLRAKRQAERSAAGRAAGGRRRGAAAAEARRAECKLAEIRRRADQVACAARAAQSPLAQLQWLCATEDKAASSQQRAVQRSAADRRSSTKPRRSAVQRIARRRPKTDRPGLAGTLANDRRPALHEYAQPDERREVETTATRSDLALTT